LWGDVIRAGSGYPIISVYNKSDDSLVGEYSFDRYYRRNKLNQPKEIKKEFRNTHGEIKKIIVGVELSGVIYFEYISEDMLRDLKNIYHYSTLTDSYYITIQPYSDNNNLISKAHITEFNFDKVDDYNFNPYFAELTYSLIDIDMSIKDVINI